MKSIPLRATVDKQVLLRLKEGDEEAFNAIYWKYSAWVYNFVYSLLHDKHLAEDLTQTVFMRIWEGRVLIQPEETFESYLFTIARNLVYKETENQLLSQQMIEIVCKRQKNHDSITEDQIDTDSLRLYIDSLIEQLPPSRKEIYLLSRHNHLSHKEIASRLSISEKTVETQIYRALQFLKRKLSDDSGLIILFALLFVK